MWLNSRHFLVLLCVSSTGSVMLRNFGHLLFRPAKNWIFSWCRNPGTRELSSGSRVVEQLTRVACIVFVPIRTVRTLPNLRLEAHRKLDCHGFWDYRKSYASGIP